MTEPDQEKPVDVHSCKWLAEGFCAASVEGYCVGGYEDPVTGALLCHG